MTESKIEAFCAECRDVTLDEIRRIVEMHGGRQRELYRLMLDYPLRPAKALRPSLCIAVCRALGGARESVLRSAAVIELLHNAFLIHDDVEDESLFRRGERTLQRTEGLPMAVNVADGMFALTLGPLLENTEIVGLGPALEILDLIGATVRITVEGQATELGWIRDNVWQFPDGNYRAAYEDMVARKTGQYSFVTPVELGAIVAAAPAVTRRALRDYAEHLGVAFQIADDLLNLRDDAEGYGKERAGDLWEGKRTLMLLHALHAESDSGDGRRALEALGRARPLSETPAEERERVPSPVRALLDSLYAAGRLDAETHRALRVATEAEAAARAKPVKTTEDVRLVEELMERHGSISYARAVAVEHVGAAQAAFAGLRDRLAPGEAREFLETLAPYVLERLR